jgi:predicted nucleic acid-binding protein
MQPHERYGTVRFLARFVTYDVNRELADRAGDLVREQAERGRTLSVPDAIIAATAIAHGLTLLTLNTTDFQEIPGLNIASLAEE